MRGVAPRTAVLFTALSAALFAATGASAAPPKKADAGGLSAARLAEIGTVVEGAIARNEVPGAVVVVGRRDRVVFRKAYGSRALVPAHEAMTLDTAFDLASLTKPIATATSVMTLVERGLVRLGDPVVRHLPAFGGGARPDAARASVTVEDLLTHRAGLVPDDPLALYTGSPAEIFERKWREPLAHAPGTRFVYSDVGFEALGELVARVTGESLDAYARARVFAPLGMRDAEFRPVATGGRLPVARIAPTEREPTADGSRGAMLRGVVHDPRARALGGVAGHAGLFGTADDVARFAAALLAGGKGVLSPATVAAMATPRYFGDDDLRGLGWDVATSYSGPRGDLLPFGSYGHTGFTGTSLWIDEATGVYLVVLTSRLHPGGKGDALPLRARLANVVASAVVDVEPKALRESGERVALLRALGRRPRTAPSPTRVLPGIDVLEAGGFSAIAGKRVGVLTNQTGRASDGRRTIDVLLSPKAKAAGVAVVRLFSPEHGLAGAKDEAVGDARDEATGLPVRSLYRQGADGTWSRRPSAEDFAGLDAVVVDLQDAGCRFYTYLTSLGYLLEEAVLSNVAVVVLDRPNPIGGELAEGPLADPDRLSFTAYHTIPIRTGMTIGELARLFAAEKKLGTKLTVVPLKGWSRALWYDETGLAWVNPSPNLRSVAQAALYPGVALLETTNVSVGRGTDAPFEQLGAPWLDGVRLAAALSARTLPGVRFTPVRFTPASSTHAGTECGGVRIAVVDRNALRPVRLGLEIAAAIRDLAAADWDASSFGKLLANADTLARFLRGEGAAAIAASWDEGLAGWRRRRAAHLLY